MSLKLPNFKVDYTSQDVAEKLLGFQEYHRLVELQIAGAISLVEYLVHLEALTQYAYDSVCDDRREARSRVADHGEKVS